MLGNLSDIQYQALEEMGIRVWVPRESLPLPKKQDLGTLPASQPESSKQSGLSAPPKAVASSVDASNEGDAMHPPSSPRGLKQDVAQTHGKPDASRAPAPEKETSLFRLRSLSLRSRGYNLLVDDETYTERSFHVDVLRSVHGFEGSDQIQETRFDWPLAGFEDASEAAARSALLAFLGQDEFAFVRGDSIANLLFGGGRWKSFPESVQVGEARIWVLGSDVDLEDAQARQRLWETLRGLKLE